MNKKNHSYHFLLFALTISIIVVYFIAKPFLGALILASISAFIFQPIYQKFLIISKKQESLAAFVTTFIAIVLIIIPMVFLGNQIFKESSHLYQSLLIEDNGDFVDSIKNIINKNRIIFLIPEEIQFDIGQYIKQGLDLLVSNFGTIFSSFAKIIINTLVFIIAFFFFLKDGGKLKNYLVALSPLDDKDDDFIMLRLKSAVLAIIKGGLTIGLIQGFLTGVGFAIFGVPNAVFWGGIAIVSAFIPGIGTALVITPAIIFLLLTNNIFGGIGLLIWGITAVGLVDNLLAPTLVGRGMQLHPLVIFIAVLGGLSFFGPLGFLLGPLAVGICMALIDIYTRLVVEKKKA